MRYGATCPYFLAELNCYILAAVPHITFLFISFVFQVTVTRSACWGQHHSTVHLGSSIAVNFCTHTNGWSILDVSNKIKEKKQKKRRK